MSEVHYTVERLKDFGAASVEVSAHTVEGARDLSAEEVRMLLMLYMRLPLAIGNFPDPNYTSQGLSFNNGDMMVVFVPRVHDGRGALGFLLFTRTY